MKFFIPGVADLDEAEIFYLMLKDIADASHGDVTARRIHSVEFTRDGRDETATVGGVDTVSGLPCIAIFETGSACLVCVEGRLSGAPLVVDTPASVQAFDPD